MAWANDPFSEAAFRAMREDSPLRDFMGSQQTATNTYPTGRRQPTPEEWLRATVAGFVSHLSVNGWRVSRRTMTTNEGVVFTWRSPRGHLLETKILGHDRARQLAHACGLLAGWQPELRYWSSAFQEVDVPTSGNRS